MIKLLMGMIASGKSTYAKEKAAEGWLTINDDSIVKLLHGEDYTLYSKELKPLYKSVEQAIVGLIINSKKSVIIDNGRANLTKSGRQRWLSIAKSADIPIEIVVFPKEYPLIHVARRLASDPRGLDYNTWVEVANTHASLWEEPSLKEGFSSILYL